MEDVTLKRVVDELRDHIFDLGACYLRIDQKAGGTEFGAARQFLGGSDCA